MGKNTKRMSFYVPKTKEVMSNRQLKKETDEFSELYSNDYLSEREVESIIAPCYGGSLQGHIQTQIRNYY